MAFQETIGTHVMGPSRLNHGESQCVNCHATDREIRLVLGPNCDNAPLAVKAEAKTHAPLVCDEGEADLVEQALAYYAKRPHLPIVQNRIKALQNRIKLVRMGMEA